jgi:hypothetical protein
VLNIGEATDVQKIARFLFAGSDNPPGEDQQEAALAALVGSSTVRAGYSGSA